MCSEEERGIGLSFLLNQSHLIAKLSLYLFATKTIFCVFLILFLSYPFTHRTNNNLSVRFNGDSS